ncbi:MAG: glycosyltransferase family 2 protein [Clostridium sp.]|nr:glycosyltransferase family 2 protein [Clostridium sp.]
MEKVLIIVPAYNEENRISRVLTGLKKYNYDTIVVNDASTDNTAGVVRQFGIKIINNPINLGAGAALQTGYKYALDNDYDYVVNLDGDGQHDPEYLTELLECVKSRQADIAIGSRFLNPESYKPPFIRILGMRLFSFIASLTTKQKFTDTTSGYKAMTKEVIKLFASPDFPSDYPDVDTLILLNLRGFIIKEIPVRMYENNEQSIHSGIIKPVYYVFKMTLSIAMTLLREKLNKKDMPKLKEGSSIVKEVIQ